MNVILITGAGKGIGFETLKLLSKNNSNIILALVRSKINLKQLKNKGNIFIFKGSVNSQKKIKQIFSFAKRKKLIINKLVNNAGERFRKDFIKIKKNEILKIFNTNFFSIFYLMQEFSKNLINKKKPGSIVNIGSIVGEHGFKQLSVYGSTKLALSALTKSFAVEMSKFNIRANCVEPGFTKTSYYKKFKTKKKLYQWTISRIPLLRWGESIEIAYLIDFLLSDKSSYITGESIKVDGGWSNA
jgi:NAD(P)-dependent dehydrogenase (short-subunit alcohol dehydrogenase family)